MVSLKVLYISLIVVGVILIYNGTIVEIKFAIGEFSFVEENNQQSRGHLHNNNNNHDDHCIVNIHGFHHSGTGYLRQKVYESIGGSQMASMHNSSVASEGEGQHLQTVYPTIGERTTNPSLCVDDDIMPLLPQKLGRIYYCPKIVSQTVDDKKKKQEEFSKPQQLFEEWSKYWDLTKPILIQKTPSFDLLYLEGMNTKFFPTVHLLVMRHPLIWNHDMMEKYSIQSKRRKREPNLLRPLIWIDVWATILDQLIHSNIQSYAIIQYETLGFVSTTGSGTDSNKKNEISTFVLSECHIKEDLLLPPSLSSSSSTTTTTTTEGTRSTTSISAKNNSPTSNTSTTSIQQQEFNDTTRNHTLRRRRLHVHEAKASEFYKPKQEIIDLMVQCRADIQCRHVMKDLEPIIGKYFGYRWDTKQMFNFPSGGGVSGSSSENVNGDEGATIIDKNNKTQADNANNRQQYPQILFSSSNPPPMDLVQGLLDLKGKYC